MPNVEVPERFEQDIKDHVVTIAQDDGVYRNIVCKIPHSGFYAFQITTWPGYLAISGDMGFNAWSRANDMFSFFRGQLNGAIHNTMYVTEKCVTKPVTKFDIDTAIASLKEWFDNHYDDPDTHDEYLEDLDTNVLSSVTDEWDFVDTVRGYTFPDGGMIDDFLGEYGLSGYDYNYLWQLLAIDWTIKQYDLQKETPNG